MRESARPSGPKAAARAGFIVLAIVCVVSAAVNVATGKGGEGPEVIRTNRVEVVNDKGITVLRLEAGPKGDGLVSIYSRQGDLLLTLPASVEGSDNKPTGAGWRDKANWRSLQKGMSEDRVRALLGQPERVTTGSFLTYWYYGSESCDVFFDTSMRLAGWNEPR